MMKQAGLAAGLMVLLAAGMVVAQEDVDYQNPQTWRQEVRNEIRSQKERLQELRDKQRMELKAKIAQIRDARIKLLVEKIGERMCTVNTNRTESMKKQLETFARILDKAEARAKTAETAVARKAIEDALTAVESQSARPCNITLTGTESAVLRADTRNSMAMLENQLKGVKEQVRQARRAVTQAIISVAKVMGEYE